MGLGPRWTCGTTPFTPPSTTEWLPNPDAKNFKIYAAIQLNTYVIAGINYPNCVNFEGNKVMVYSGITLKQLLKQKEIDPHFKDGDKFSPIARFTPTNEGWRMAMAFVDTQLKAECVFRKKRIFYGDLFDKKGKWNI